MRLFYLILVIWMPIILKAQNWSEIRDIEVQQTGIRDIQPEKFTLYSINDNTIKQILWSAPDESFGVKNSEIILSVGLPENKVDSFRIVRYSMMESELSQKYPDIRTFIGVSTQETGTKIRIDYTSEGFRAVVSSIDKDKIFIDHYQRGDKNTRIVYFKKDYKRKPSWGCQVDESFIKSQGIDHHLKWEERTGDCVFRSYRLAQAATGEYSNYFGADDPSESGLVLSAVTTGINRINEVYESEVAVRLILVANTDQVFYYNPATDPYTGSNASAMLTENTPNCNSVIGSNNYDIGHIFSAQGNNGVAYLSSVCNNTLKAGGVTISVTPVNDPFYIDYVAHEMGHQFGGNHTQNNGCNRNSPTAMEPGSASSIMGYAGICPPNVQSNSDAYFHAISLQEIKAFLMVGGASCDQIIPNYNNVAPVVLANPDYTIPKSTPFVLTLSATDADNDAMVYAWDQMDAQTATMPPATTNTSGPTFRSINFTSAPYRYFPNLTSILSGANTNTWEVLPSVGRTMNFRGVVRDVQEAGTGGCNSEDNVVVTTVAAAGPFLITSQNTPTTWVETQQANITWDVAGTTGNGINCSTVDILLSYNGGQSFSTVLATGVANNGSYNITVPFGLTTTGRIMVKANGNIFFDINNANITIDPGVLSFSLEANPANIGICPGQSKNIIVNVNPILGYTQAVTLSLPGLPSGFSASFGVNPVIPGNTTVLTITNNSAPVGTTNQTLNGVSGSINKNISLVLISNNGLSLGLPSLTVPANNSINQNIRPAFSWTPLANASRYDIQITRSSNFSEVIFNIENIAATSLTFSGYLEGGTVYFWRVRGENDCNTGNWSSPFTFTTESCYYYPASDLPIPIPSSGAQTINSYKLISDKGTITDLDVLNLTGLHSYIDDLRFTMFSPSGTSVIIWNRPCDNHQNFNINFNQAAPAGSWPCPPTNAGTFRPSNTINTFNNLSLKGQWRLRVEDLFNLDGGSLNSWGIKTCVNNFCRLTVDNAFSRGAGSLYDAVLCAQSGDTIRFSNSLNNDTIYLGNLNLSIDKDLVLECNILRNIHIISTSSSPLIVNSAPGAGLGLRIKGLHIHSSNSNIGAVDNRGKLILENVYLYTFSPGGTATIENKSGGTAEITGDCRIIRD
ncbi:MAG: proprotein convertase P-domain-containing protein [Saprospiraceae bacterium]|nr:proprotein convertase P-domain-containing protein [Saprospiraceae bacterium]